MMRLTNSEHMSGKPAFVFLLGCCMVASGWAGYGDPDTTYPEYPDWGERTLIVLTNACRMDPQGYRDTYIGIDTILKVEHYPPVAPVYWNVDLNRAARAHAQDMADNCGMQHNSCDGTMWYTRIRSYYNVSTLAENILTGLSDPMDALELWITEGTPPAPDNSSSDGHRRNLMSSNYNEIGTGYAYGSVAWYHYWVQDFGGATSGFAPHPIALGSHVMEGTDSIVFMVNYYDAADRNPLAASVFIDDQPYPLTVHLGDSAQGTYVYGTAAAGDCRLYYYQFQDADGQDWRMPEDGYFVTYGEGSCTTDYEEPVVLSAFSAVHTGDAVELRWATQSEQNNLGFNILRSDSTDGAFLKVNRVLIPGAGTTTQPQEYSFTDRDAMNRTRYYRLEQVDINGNRDYADVIAAYVPAGVTFNSPIQAVFTAGRPLYNLDGTVNKAGRNAAPGIYLQQQDGALVKVLHMK